MFRLIGKIVETNINELSEFFTKYPVSIVPFLLAGFIGFIVIMALYALIAWAFIKLSNKIFRTIEKKRGKKIHLQFAENIIKLVIIILFVVIPLGGDQISKSILGSAAVLAAVVGFAAQDVIKDVLSGLQISLYKPFDIGDRIELEDGTAGIVDSITMRHVVLTLIDTVKLIIPNSKLNTATIRNLSYEYVPRSAEFTFPVHYDSDIAKAKSTIFEAVKASPYSFPGKRSKSGEMIYAPVYFIALSDSALNMKVTVYYESSTPTEVLKDDINTRVFEALGNAGITIPYSYTSVVLEQA